MPLLLVEALFWLRGVLPPMKSGSLIKASGMLVGVVADSCSAVTTVSGVGLASKPSFTKKDGAEPLGKVAAKNNIKGRTLVELQQALEPLPFKTRISQQ